MMKNRVRSLKEMHMKNLEENQEKLWIL